jgi:NAD(P)-dependent dehydrogenase (short-subunit alcohol dehydrogenase family)
MSLQMMRRLDGKVALVTGAGRGIGRAVVLRLAEEGASVALAARTEEQLVDTANLLDTPSLVLPADVAAEGAAEQLVQATEEGLGRMDVLVNAAGISPVYTRAEKLQIEDWDLIMSVNVRAGFQLAQAAGRRMLANGGGSIVNVASIGGLVALPRLAAYCASKGALVQLTRVLAVEWADRNVRVNAVAPGYVRTEFTRSLLEHPEISARLLASTPARRFAEPEEIAPAVAFLASDDASYITGAVLTADGGWTAA